MNDAPAPTAYVVYDRRTGCRVVSPDGQWEIHQTPVDGVLDSPIFRYNILTWGGSDGE